MMNRVMRLGDRDAESLMTPRTRIAWLDASESYEENLATMRATPFSRYPVYRDGDEEVLGVLEVKSLLDRLDQREQDLFRDLRAALFVSESTPALKLLEILREDRQSLAMVRSEEHTSELQSLMRISYAVFCLKKKTTTQTPNHTLYQQQNNTHY